MLLKYRNAILAWAENHEDLFDDRLLIVSGIYFLAFIEFDVDIAKAFASAIAVYVVMAIPLGRHLLERLCVVLFVCAILRWTNIAGINELVETARNNLIHVTMR